MDLEYCCKCDQPTGRANEIFDSIYIGGPDEEIGPLCKECCSNYCVCNECGDVIEDTNTGLYSVKDETWECSDCKPRT